MDIEVRIEIRSSVKKNQYPSADGNTHNFIVYVQGSNGSKIEHFVRHVVFYLPSHFKNPTRIRRSPPYLISGSTTSSFRFPIDVFLNISEKLNKWRYSYYLLVPDKPDEKSTCVKTLTFSNIPQDFRERLLLGGGELVQPREKYVAGEIRVKTEPVEEAVDFQSTSNSSEHLIGQRNPTENTNDQEEINHFPDSSIQSREISESDVSFNIQSIYSFDELLKENGNLKSENETLNKKYSHQESLVANYVEKLSVLRNRSSEANAELSQLKQKAEANKTEMSSLKLAVQILQSEILQHKAKSNEVKKKMKKPEIPVIAVNNINFKAPAKT